MEKIKCLFNMIMAYGMYPFVKRIFKDRKIWLVGGNGGELYVDNARGIYEYLIENVKDIEVIWIVNENSTIKDKIKGKYIIKGSIKGYLYFMNAQVALFSHSISADIVPYLYVIPFLNKFHFKILKVFLNHGTVGFKVRKALNEKTEKLAEKMVRSYDINICDSNYEGNIKHSQWWNVPKKTVYLTGYPRYDQYIMKNENLKNRILYMPTWRPWLRNDFNLSNSQYFQNIVNFINNKKLNDFLEKNNIQLNVYIHQLMHQYFQEFENIKLNKKVHILDKGADISKELKDSKLLITDYSSVAYDFLYMNKPILFYQFDKDEYEEKIGSYINLDEDLFGEIAYEIESCVNKLMDIVNNDYKYGEEEYGKIKEKGEKFLYYRDDKNCERVYNIIIEKLGEKNG